MPSYRWSLLYMSFARFFVVVDLPPPPPHTHTHTHFFSFWCTPIWVHASVTIFVYGTHLCWIKPHLRTRGSKPMHMARPSLQTLGTHHDSKPDKYIFIFHSCFVTLKGGLTPKIRTFCIVELAFPLIFCVFGSVYLLWLGLCTFCVFGSMRLLCVRVYVPFVC